MPLDVVVCFGGFMSWASREPGRRNSVIKRSKSYSDVSFDGPLFGTVGAYWPLGVMREVLDKVARAHLHDDELQDQEFKSDRAIRRKPRLIIMNIGPCSSDHDRSCEAFYHLKGGRVDYGAEHAQKAGHNQFGWHCGEGAYPEFDSDHRIHIVGHSVGGNSALLFYRYICDDYFNVGSNASWIASVTTIASPVQGTTLTYVFGVDPITAQMKPYTYGHLVSLCIGFYVKTSQVIAPLKRVFDFATPQWAHVTTWRNVMALTHPFHASKDNSTHDMDPVYRVGINQQLASYLKKHNTPLIHVVASTDFTQLKDPFDPKKKICSQCGLVDTVQERNALQQRPARTLLKLQVLTLTGFAFYMGVIRYIRRKGWLHVGIDRLGLSPFVSSLLRRIFKLTAWLFIPATTLINLSVLIWLHIQVLRHPNLGITPLLPLLRWRISHYNAPYELFGADKKKWLENDGVVNTAAQSLPDSVIHKDDASQELNRNDTCFTCVNVTRSKRVKQSWPDHTAVLWRVANNHAVGTSFNDTDANRFFYTRLFSLLQTLP